MTAAAAAAELLAGDGQDLDAGLRQAGVRGFVPFVGYDDAGRQRDDVVAVVPLRALGFELVAGGRGGLQLLDPHRVLHLLAEGPLPELRLNAPVSLRPL